MLKTYLNQIDIKDRIKIKLKGIFMDQKITAILDSLSSMSGKLKEMEKDYGNLIDKISKHPRFDEKELQGEDESVKTEVRT